MQMTNVLMRMTDVYKIYEGSNANQPEVVALRGVNLEIMEGEFLALIGSSGSGKSTLISVLGGLTKPTAGSIFFKDKDITRFNAKQLTEFRRNNVGFVFQQNNLIPRFSALENVMIPLKFTRHPDPKKRAWELLEAVGLENRAHHRPSELSGGEIQRVAIATALANKPAIILGDEITGELDMETSEQIMSLLKTLNHNTGMTLVIVTHSPEVASQADRILSIRDGQVLNQRFSNNPNEVISEVDSWGRVVLPPELRTRLKLRRYLRIKYDESRDVIEIHPADSLMEQQQICPNCLATISPATHTCPYCKKPVTS